ncbi:MAG: prepilin-type N-terminal cleavage/methylation domain-containing protein [Armatimonadetes bacterium]|nr:prepilin-type N-terminal cleavage/methylation domain-containing protein [Armatimonadota bacterium]
MSMCRQRQKAGRWGFSLIELLVVIAIIAVLAAILFPMLGKARSSAFRANCQSNMKQMMIALFLYAEDSNGRTPGAWYKACHWGDGEGWTERIAYYVGGKKRKIAPGSREKAVFKCPQQKSDYSYGIVAFEDPISPVHSSGFLLSQIKSTKKMVMFYEMHPRYPSDSPDVGETGQSNDEQQDLVSYYYGVGNPKNRNLGYDYWVYWPGPHETIVNFSFVDGHIAGFPDFDAKKITWTNAP